MRWISGGGCCAPRAGRRGLRDHRHPSRSSAFARSPMPADGALIWRAPICTADGVRHREAQIVVAVHRDDGLSMFGTRLNARDDAVRPGRHRVAHGVRNVDGAGAGLDGGLHHAAEVDRCTTRIPAGELHVVGVAQGVLDGADPHLQHVFGSSSFSFALHADGRGEMKVDAKRLGQFSASPAASMSFAGREPGRRPGCS